METQKQAVTPVTIAIRFGLLIALVSIIVDFAIRVVGVGVLVYGVVAGTAGLIITVVGVIMAHRAFKEANLGLMTYGQGIIISLIMMLVSGVASALFNYVYVNYVDPDFVNRMKDEMIAFMERNHLPDDQIAKSTAGLEEMRPPLLKGLLNGVRNGLIGGTVLGVIISAFTKRKPADFE
jgi:hypothetical protein